MLLRSGLDLNPQYVMMRFSVTWTITIGSQQQATPYYVVRIWTLKYSPYVQLHVEYVYKSNQILKLFFVNFRFNSF